jgi:hypothetical protein
MNCLKARRKYDDKKEREYWEKRLQEEKEKVEAMSPDERKAYEEEKRKKRNLTMQVLGMATALGGPYSSDGTLNLIKELNRHGY